VRRSGWLAWQAEKKRLQAEEQRRLDEARKEVERLETRRRAEADALLKSEYYKVRQILQK
jgi:hypothetical protein